MSVDAVSPSPLGLKRNGALQGAALALSALGVGLIGRWPLGALAAFAAGGLCLVLARRDAGGILQDQIPPLEPRQKWEPYFLAALMVLGLLSFGWKLGSIPEGANYSEGMLAVRAAGMADPGAAYIAHDDGEISWPTLFHYEGALAVRLFGKSPASYRLPSVLWALLILAVVYFTLRVLFSAPTAAAGSLLWLAFHFNMHFARRYCPIIVLYMPPYLGLAAIVLGLRTGRWWWWAAAGFAIGLSLHGYLPGRVVPGVFVIFSAWLWLRRAKFSLHRNQLVLMWAAFFITAYPILKYAVTNTASYNSYFKLWSAVNTDSSNGVKPSIQPYLTVFENQVTPYLLMFHVRGNSEYEEDDSYGHPVLDPVMGILFPLGFFLCLWTLWRGVPLYLMVLFWAGLMPGIFSKLGVPPFPRREVIAFPAVFMMAGLVVEELRLGLFSALSVRRWLGAWVLLGSALLVVQWRHYWVYTHTPGFRRFTDVMGYYTGQELEAHRGARALASQSILQSSPSFSLLTHANAPVAEIMRAEDFVFLGPGQETMLLLPPYLEPLIPTLQELYPHADLKLYREPAYADRAFLDEQMHDTIFNAFCADITNPSLILARMLVPAADLDARAGWLIEGSPGGVLKDSDASASQAKAGQRLSLAASVAVNTLGDTLTVHLDWPGWSLKVDGKRQALNKPFFARGNFGVLQLEGRVPSGASGAFPAQILAGPGKSRLSPLAWHPQQGLTVAFLAGQKPDWDRKENYDSTLLVPALRFDEDYKLVYYPAQLRVSGSFSPPTSGEWHMRLGYPGGGIGALHLAGATAPPMSVSEQPTEVAVTLAAGVAVPLRIDYEMQLSQAPATALMLQTKAPGDDAWRWIDAHTLRPR